MGSTRQFCLKWDSHQRNLLSGFDLLLQKESLVDVTLACGGLRLKAHKVVLSACSPYFQELFQENPCQHPIVILRDVPYDEMKCLIEFMYKGEVNVAEEKLVHLLNTANSLQVKALTEINQPVNTLNSEGNSTPSVIVEAVRGETPPEPPSPKSPKRKKLRAAPNSTESPSVDRVSSASSDRSPVTHPKLLHSKHSPWSIARSSKQYQQQDVEEVKCEPALALDPDFGTEPPGRKEHNGVDEPKNEIDDCGMGDISDAAGEHFMEDYDNTDYCFVKSQRGGQLLLRRGYVFKINKTGPKGRKYYRCYRDVETGCKARAIIWRDVLNDIGEHNHEPEQEFGGRRCISQNLNETNCVTPNQILPTPSAFDDIQSSANQRSCRRSDCESSGAICADGRMWPSSSLKRHDVLPSLPCNV